MSSQDVHTRSAITTPMSSVRNREEVAKLIDVSKYIGCKACQVACSEWNELRDEVGHNYGTYDNPMDPMVDSRTVMCFIEYENEADNLERPTRRDGCMHCVEPGCLKACPSPGAIVKYASGIINLNQDKCIGCGYCTTGCPFDIPWISQKDRKIYECNLCSDRVLVGMEPACVKTCPIGAIVFGSKGDVKEHAAERIVGLKSRGCGNAGLYDPEGMGSTHAMHVLHYADKSSPYADLADQPSTSPLISLWKGVTKPLALLAMGATALTGLSHYVRVGPNRADGEENYGQAEASVHQVDSSVHIFDSHERC